MVSAEKLVSFDIQTACGSIGHREDARGRVVARELMLQRGGMLFSINVLGIPVDKSVDDEAWLEPPPLAVGRKLLDDPGRLCEFLAGVPFVMLAPHLVVEE